MLTGRDAALRAVKVLRQGGDFRAETRKCEDARERAFAENLAMTLARNLLLIDRHIAHVSSVPLNKLEPVTLDLLRVAVCQLMFFDKVPASAAINEAVNAAKRRTKNAAPFVNAVLRRLARDGFPAFEFADERERLSVLYSHPRWYVDALCVQFSVETTENILRADNTVPPIYCAANTQRTDVEALAAPLAREGADVRRLDNPAHMLALTAPGDITRYTAYQNGWFYVQDPGAFRVAEACGAKPGDTVIDLCAAPGGKSFALANLMRGEGKILARDTPGRVGLIADGVNRLGITNIEVRAGDAMIHDAALVECADIVLVDAPCSGFGAIRKKPEIRYKPQTEIAGLPDIQLGILDCASAYVRRGGKLVYATCTLLRDENDAVADRFLAAHDDYAEQSRETVLPSADSDGFYIFTAVRRV